MSDRSVHVGGSVVGGTVVTGDRNTVSTTYTHTELPAAETVDIKAEVAAIQALLAGIESEHKTKIGNAMSEAAEEAAKDEPDKDEVGKALERAVDYAKKANGFAEQVDKLVPHVKAACSWLGENWHKLLALVGVAI